MIRFVLAGLLMSGIIGESAVFAELPSGVVDTQPNGEKPLSPQLSLKKISVPDGFRVTLFAGEPDVYQPISMDFDDRGRLWVVECFSYPDWQTEGKDRIVILEDTDNDGVFDSRKLFADQLSNVTGMALGFGGIWICSAPHLLFIPDRDRDDQPDGPAVVKLVGWNDDGGTVKHNVFNGMKWGPDGWLYGGHGILDTSLVGKPGSDASQRKKINCGIWRYHPVHEEFEVVAHGTTNPWGIDFDELEQGFFSNSVIGHLWHLLPGARYRRMYGSHFNPYTYTLVEACADHFHWGHGSWQDSRDGHGVHGEAGGGHAHCGALIYQGGLWPKEYHGSFFTANLHGNRLNRDSIRRRGSSYVAKHEQDFLFGNDPWFRGISIKCGPDGNVFVSDWTDLGECHDNDGTHRSSGRIYKIVFGDPKPLPPFDLAKATNEELLNYVDHPNKWYWEHARRLLHERAASRQDLAILKENTLSRLGQEENTVTRIRLNGLLALIGSLSDDLVAKLLSDSDEELQSWAIRYVSQETYWDFVDRFVELATSTKSLKVRLDLAVALQTLPLGRRWELATALLENFPDTKDKDLGPMTWFGIEPLADADRNRFLNFLSIKPSNQGLSEIRQFVVRRVLADEKQPMQTIAAILSRSYHLDVKGVVDVAKGLELALDGRRFPRPPSNWASWRLRFENRAEMRTSLLTLGAKFRDTKTTKLLRETARESSDLSQRQLAIQILAQEKISGTSRLLHALVADRAIREAAIRQLASFNDPTTPRVLLGVFSQLDPREKSAAVDTLCTRKPYASALLNEIEKNRISPRVISPIQAAKINQLRDAGLRQRLARVWGDVNSSPREAKQAIAKWKAILTSERMSNPDLQRGRKLFADNCGKCHKLFGQGGDIGPELTGADRRNLDYLLENVITPSAVVAKDYRVQSVSLQNGKIESGVILNQTRTTLELQTADKKIVIAREDILDIEPTQLSLMPTGQFDVMKPEEVRDLVGYLRSSR